MISRKVEEIPPSGIRKFFDLLLGMENVISLGVGEPDFVTPWRIREACIYALEEGYTSYTSNWGIYELREAISRSFMKEHSLFYSPENEILITTGASEAIDLAIRALVDPGDEVLIAEPCYVSYRPCVILSHGIPVSVPTREENEFRLTAEDVEERITERTKMLILNYPNNPTGATMRKKDLEEIADVAVEHDLVVLSDEIYNKLTYAGKHTVFSSLEGMKERTVVVDGFSKSHAMTGWRIGFALGPSKIIAAMMKIHQYTMLCAPITAQMAALEALNSDGEMREMINEYNRRRMLMVNGLRKIGLKCFEPKGAFYAFPSIKETGLSSQEFAERLLKEKGVAVIPGDVFGEGGEGYIRCSYAVSREKIKEALGRMEEFLSSL
ncbi:MAG: aminotransferase [Archaeoglobi archaeon]|nr:aminotransferase class I/II-fold pyridoxal phosphate-dependent enzyme [Candidatus Mnemosynella bozhongmuii]MDI3502818.1 aminotransferase [Archaeoglobi archaeon]MDK2781134.1 aminotransferase [Archaeoglobi archaeon]